MYGADFLFLSGLGCVVSIFWGDVLVEQMRLALSDHSHF